MSTIKAIITFLLIIFAATAFATSWAPVYPYIQKTENGNVKSHSFPYAVYDGGYGSGETFVYAKGKFLYSIDKYFTSPFFTVNNGQYLIELNFHLQYRQSGGLLEETDERTPDALIFEGDAVNIYKDGKLFRTIDFNELNVDTSKLNIDRNWQVFSWNYNSKDSNTDVLKMKMAKYPAFIENDRLFLISADNQLIEIDVVTGKITNNPNAYESLQKLPDWNPVEVFRKYKKTKYPDKFLLPKLADGTTIEQGLAEFLNKKPSEGERSVAVIQIYVNSLLINEKGLCESVYVSTGIRNDLEKDFNQSPQLTIEIEAWLKQQTFKINTFPKKFRKYEYSDFVYLR